MYIKLLNTIAIKNKYLVIHNNIITRAQARANTKYEAQKLLGYCEGHHIVPKSFKLGGDKDACNIVYLTAKEHIIIHRLLCKITTDKYRICSLRAYHAMCYINNGGQDKRYPSTHELAKAREAVSIANKGKRRMNKPKWFTEGDTLDDFKQALEEHVADFMSDPEIGDLYGVSSTAIHNWRKKLDIKKRRWQLSDPAWLEQKYYIHKLSCQDIADILKCTSSAVQLAMKKFDIPVRDASERQQNVPKNRRGYFPAVDVFGNKYSIKKDDPRYLSGELVGLHKGKVAITNGMSIKYIRKEERIPEGWYLKKS
jgi:predicted DNA-binding protein YlxM (UPF0122 family)